MSGDALLSWVRALGGAGSEVQEFGDLADGIVLLELTTRIAPQMFDDSGFNRNTDGNWLLNATNIKVLISQLRNIYSTLLKKDASGHINQIDANAIAKDKNVESTQRLVELVLGAAVQCESKDDFIRVIMTMPQTTQQVLMGLIQQQMTTFPAIDPNAPSQDADSPSPPPSPLLAARSSFSDELREEIDSLQREKTELSSAHSELTEEAEALRAQVEELTAAAAQEKEEAKRLRTQLRESEVRADDMAIDLESAQQQLESREDQLKQLRKQMEESKSQNQNQALLDELDVLRDKLVNAQKNEVLLTKAKKRLEELSELPSQIQSLEEQNAMLVKEAQAAAGSSSKANAKQQEISQLNAAKADLEAQIKELQTKVTERDSSLEKAQEIQNGLIAENQQLKTTTLELQQEIALKEDFDNSPGGLELGIGGELVQAENSAELAEQQALVAHLQQENDALQASIAQLEEQVSTSKVTAEANQSTEQKLQDATSQHSELQRENVRLGEQLQNSEQEVSRLKEAYTKAVQVCQSLKNRLQESISQSGEVGSEKLAEVQASLDLAEKKQQEAEERACQAEAALQSKASDMRALAEDLKCANEESDGLKQRLSEVVAQSEMQARRLANEEAQMSTSADESQEVQAHRRTIQSLQTQLTEQEKNLANTKQQLEESTKLKDNEIKLVSTAFYEVGLELQKRWKTPQVGKTWLSKRRQMINQERRVQ